MCWIRSAHTAHRRPFFLSPHSLLFHRLCCSPCSHGQDRLQSLGAEAHADRHRSRDSPSHLSAQDQRPASSARSVRVAIKNCNSQLLYGVNWDLDALFKRSVPQRMQDLRSTPTPRRAPGFVCPRKSKALSHTTRCDNHKNASHRLRN
ncbi:hypothetical protein IE81DRAFT_57060 [Ceraceosorus guamensis]|uniref:Uncharacterized protein n=1 Tax=Ceraceosorus guamensis TaxID=1522189 RepID=A0A316VN94_9BASI|nr:hypothetical protein IE81DRAFT_57060 [Ceraceosorus guamensis]PWN39037.1 hypothetical protein IE81DRAFT_57060 [Ceraceosorus guamensis]